MAPDPERPFLEHLEALRRCLVRSLAFAAVGMVAALLSFGRASAAIQAQLAEAYRAVGHPEDFNLALVSLSPTDVAGLLFKFALAGGLLLALPFILVQVWSFASPALRGRERQVGLWLLLLGPLFFVGGFLFSFWKVAPLAAECLLSLSYHYGFVPRWTAESYYGFFLMLNLGFGACFELPLVMMLLSAIGLAGPEVYARYRRHWIVASFVIGSILPPPELVSMCIQAAALVVLYEVGILFAKLVRSRKPAPQA